MWGTGQSGCRGGRPGTRCVTPGSGTGQRELLWPQGSWTSPHHEFLNPGRRMTETRDRGLWRQLRPTHHTTTFQTRLWRMIWPTPWAGGAPWKGQEDSVAGFLAALRCSTWRLGCGWKRISWPRCGPCVTPAQEGDVVGRLQSPDAITERKQCCPGIQPSAMHTNKGNILPWHRQIFCLGRVKYMTGTNRYVARFIMLRGSPGAGEVGGRQWVAGAAGARGATRKYC